MIYHQMITHTNLRAVLEALRVVCSGKNLPDTHIKLFEGMDPGVRFATLNMYGALLDFEHHGSQVFRVGEHVLNGLLQTTVNVAGRDCFRLPYPTVMVDLPVVPDHWRLDISDADFQRSCPIAALYLSDVKAMHCTRRLSDYNQVHHGGQKLYNFNRDGVSISMVTRLPDGVPFSKQVQAFYDQSMRDLEKAEQRALERGWAFDAHKERERIDSTCRVLDSDNFRLHIPYGFDLDRQTNLILEETIRGCKGTSHLDTQRLTENMLREIIGFSVNLCMYLSSPEPDVEVVSPGPDAKKLHRLEEAMRWLPTDSRIYAKKEEKHQKELTRTAVTLVGPRIERSMEEYAARAAAGDMPSCLVRGHFQRYPVGPRISGKRLWKWKNPYEKGLDDLPDGSERAVSRRERYDVKRKG